MVIALLMRAAARSSPSVPPEVRALIGMQAAYAYVKQKSKWVGPNMSSVHPRPSALQQTPFLMSPPMQSYLSIIGVRAHA